MKPTFPLVLLGLISIVTAFAAQPYPPKFDGARVETYKTVGDVKLSLHIFEPPGPVQPNRPAIVFFFGGGWTNGSPVQFEQQCRHFASRGMVAITADYRVASRQQVKASACVADAKSAIRWLRQNAQRLGIDPQRIAAGGGSAGGHIAATTGTVPGFDEAGEDTKVSSVPNALVLFNPALVLAPLEGLDLQGFETRVDAERMGTDPQNLSPAHHVRRGAPPTIIFHGRADTTVPFNTAEAFTKLMEKAGNRCELVGYEGQAHGFFNYGRANGRYAETLAAADKFLVSLGYLAAVSAAATGGSGSTAKTRPNVLFFFMDDQRADTIAALGNVHIKTPNIDRLVQKGVAFRRAYMMGGMQGATCVPSRAMLLSGMSLFHIDEKLMRDETWPAAFGRAGYDTFISGKWHNTPPSIPKSFQRARSMFVGGMTDPMKAKLSHVEKGQLTPPQVSEKHACAVFADEAIAFIREQHTAPFFCYVPFDGPHDPHIVPDDFPIKYDPAKIPLPANFLPQHPWDNGEMSNRDESLLPWPRTSENVRAMLADYYRYVSYLDAQIGRVLEALDASPQAKNTIVVFAADSGVARGSHGLIGKQNLYEHSMRVPLIIGGPGILANQKTDAMCYLFDVMPTLGALCGVAAPTTSEGMDLSPILRQPSKPARASMMFAYRNVQRALRDDQWKLIRYPQVDRTQLFDLKSDPHELTNLADRPEHATRVAAMTAALAAEMKRLGDPVTSLTVADPKPATFTPPTEPSPAKAAKKKKA
jgi:arylsulfatase A-like enzyme/acetyl esterase/lipase